jgi:hypothetical protein
MKTGQVGMCFQLLPTLHLDKPTNDGGKNIIIIKPYDYYNKWYNCVHIVITSYKHTLHPFCLGAMLQNYNKCVVYKQNICLDWWSSWGINEKNEEMKELIKDMQLKSVQQNLVNNELKVTENGLELKSKGECNFNPIYNLLNFSCCFSLHLYNLFLSMFVLLGANIIK